MYKKEVLIFLLFLVGCALSCPDNCNDCDPSGNICFACKQDYQLSVLGKCVSNVIDKCIVYGPTNQCFVCQPSFELSGNRCVKQYTGCVNKNTIDGSCYECGFGKVLQNNICVGTINCGIAEDPCQACAAGSQLSNGRCVDKTQGCVSSRGTDGLCAECKVGYKMMGYRCVLQNLMVPYCYIYYSQSGCERCKNGYSLFQSFCLLPIQIQAILQGTNTIQKTILALRAQVAPATTITTNIKPDVKPANNTTSTPSAVPNCFRQNSGVCLECNQGFVLASGICKTVDLNCASYQLTSGRCVGCISGFELQKQVCVKKAASAPISNCQVVNPSNSNTCLICTYGYYPSGNTCAKVSRLCDGFNVQNGNCFGCFYGLQLNAGKCIDLNCQNTVNQACTTCASNYKVNSNGVCQFVDSNCVKLVGSQCDTCKTGFYPNFRGICIKLAANCRFGNIQTQGVCIQCNDGFTLSSSGVCNQQSSTTIANCALVQNNACQSCNPGYTVRQGACIKTSPICSGYNQGTCTGCVSGYTFINGLCVDLNCVNQQEERCLQCRVNYQVMAPSTLCTFYDPNCIALGANGCQTCATGWTVSSNGTCTASQQANCITFQNGNCLTCSANYYPKNGICLKASILCSGYNAGQCVGCVNGYTFINGGCIDLNCVNQQQDNCLQCRDGYSKGSSGLCEKSSNSNSGATTNNNGTSGGPSSGDRDPNCKQYSNGVCATCSSRYYIDKSAKCVPVNPLCKDYNSLGNCTSCYQGYALSSGICAASQQLDPYCKTKNAVGGCVQCYAGYFLNSTKCAGLNPLCKTSNLTNGYCLTCYPGYSLTGVACSVSFKDPNCQQYDSNNLCSKCSTRYYYNQGKSKCDPVNILCKQYSTVSGLCTTCYSGYQLRNGVCAINNAGNSDANCKTVDQNGLCSQCYTNFYVKVGKCVQISLLCKTANNQLGNCLSCYPGYRLLNGDCVIPPATQQGDTSCKQFIDSTSSICKACYDGYYVKNGVCTQFNTLCKSNNLVSGACLSCYPGYSLINGECVILNVAVDTNSDSYCISKQGAACLKCAQGYFLDPKGICQQVDPLCKTYNNANGDCYTCYDGYSLSSGTCIIPVVAQIPFCLFVHPSGKSCVECIQGYWSKNGTCTPVQLVCGGQYNKLTGICTGCLNGYFFQSGQCVNPSLGLDPACQHYANTFCDKCSVGFYLSSYVCTEINGRCLTFDYQKSVCTSCYGAYKPSGAQCV